MDTGRSEFTGAAKRRYSGGRVLPLIPAFLLLVLLFYVLVHKTDLNQDLSIRGDFYQYFLPLTDLGFDMMYRGDAPLWNPYIFCGMPLNSSIELGFFYPPNWIHLLLQSDHSFNILVFLHILFAFAGTFFYCRRRAMSVSASVVSAMVYGFSGAMTLHLWAGHMSMVYSMAWLPAILLSLEKCFEKITALRVLALTGCLACQFLAGFPMFTLAVALILIPYVGVFGCETGRRGRSGKNPKLLGTLMVVAAFSFALISIQFWPTVDFMNNSHRGALDYHIASAYSFPLRGLLTFFIPDLFGDQITTLYWGSTFIWESVVFCGVTPFLLCLFAFADIRKNRFVMFWVLVGVFMMGLSFGKNSFIYGIAFHLVPGLKFFRAVNKFCFFATFAVGILAGKGLDVLLSPAGQRLPRPIVVVLLVAVVVGVTGAGVSSLGLMKMLDPPQLLPELLQWTQADQWTNYNFTPEDIEIFTPRAFQCMLRSMLISSLAVLAASFTMLALGLNRPGYVSWVPIILLSILALELYLYDFRYFERSQAQPLARTRTNVEKMLSGDASLWRISALGPTMEFVNRFIFDRFYDIGGYENSVITRYDLFIKKITGRTSSWSNTYLQVPYNENVYDMLNVKYVTHPIGADGKNDAGGTIPIYASNSGKYGLSKRKSFLERVFIVHQADLVDSVDKALERLPEAVKKGATAATVIECPQAVELTKVNEVEKQLENVEVIAYDPNEIQLQADMVGPGFLVLSDNHYPGWKAYVDGKEEPIYPANVFMRAVYLTKGRHSIIMKFKPASFSYGAAVSLAAAVLYVVVLMITSVRYWHYRKRDKFLKK